MSHQCHIYHFPFITELPHMSMINVSLPSKAAACVSSHVHNWYTWSVWTSISWLIAKMINMTKRPFQQPQFLKCQDDPITKHIRWLAYYHTASACTQVFVLIIWPTTVDLCYLLYQNYQNVVYGLFYFVKNLPRGCLVNILFSFISSPQIYFVASWCLVFILGFPNKISITRPPRSM